MLQGGEVLGLAFTGDQVRHSIGLQLAGQALAALDDLVSMLAAAMYGSVGKRGPASLPTGIGALRLDDVAWGSAAFYFTPGQGEAFQLRVEGDETELTSKIDGVVDELMNLVDASSGQDVIEVARRYSDRVAARYVEFLEIVVTEGADLAWQTQRRSVVMPAASSGKALALLEQIEEVRVEHLDVEGLLYEANARSRGFRLVQDDGRLILGHFEEALYPVVGEAWNHRVHAAIRVRVERLARSHEERRSFELTGLEVIDGRDH